jgi:hypothetical protein
MKTLTRIFLTILLTSAIWSCGTRNTKKTDIKEEIKTEIDASEKKEINAISETKTDVIIQNNIVDQSENLTPIDPSKPMTKTVEEKDGKKITTYENANVSSGSKTDKSLKNEKTEQITKTDSKVETHIKSKQRVKKVNRNKQSESDKGFGISFWWLLLLFIPGVIYFFLRIKNRG